MRKLLLVIVSMVLLSGAAWGQSVLKGHMEDPTAWKVDIVKQCKEKCMAIHFESGTTGQYLYCVGECVTHD